MDSIADSRADCKPDLCGAVWSGPDPFRRGRGQLPFVTDRSPVRLEFMRGEEALCVEIRRASFVAFENNHGEGSFRRLAELLAMRCQSLTEIGREFGLTRERIRQLNHRWFEYLWGSGRKRQRTCTLTRPHASFTEEVLAVWREARKQGLSVSYVNYITGKDSEVKTRRWVLEINGLTCAVHLCSKPFIPTGNTHSGYFRLRQPMPIDMDYVVLVGVNEDRRQYYVLPATFLEQSALHLYFRADVQHEYQDAWHLLRNSDSASRSAHLPPTLTAGAATKIMAPLVPASVPRETNPLTETPKSHVQHSSPAPRGSSPISQPAAAIKRCAAS